MEWIFKGSCASSNFSLFGVNIFAYKWNHTGQKAEVVDPIYKTIRHFYIWAVIIDGKSFTFAAGEFSNNVWGFYLPKSFALSP